MILTGKKILDEIKNGEIQITPFNKKNIQPNSYDFHLEPSIICYDNFISSEPCKPKLIKISKNVKASIAGISVKITASLIFIPINTKKTTANKSLKGLTSENIWWFSTVWARRTPATNTPISIGMPSTSDMYVIKKIKTIIKRFKSSLDILDILLNITGIAFCPT